MKHLLLFFLIATASVHSCQNNAGQQQAAPSDGQPVISEVLTPAAFQAKMAEIPNLQLIDVRTPEEFAQGHIDGALNLNFYDDDFTQQLEQKLDKNRPVMLYCRSGNRSGQAASQMVTMGFKELYDLKGGFMAWPK